MDLFTKKMIKKYKKVIGWVIVFLMLFNFGFAQQDVVEIENPIKFETITELIETITNVLIQLGLSLIVLMVIIGALYIMTSGGDPEKVTKGKNVIKWTVLGVGVVLFARALLEVISFVISG